jgi:hypothetical protein
LYNIIVLLLLLLYLYAGPEVYGLRSDTTLVLPEIFVPNTIDSISLSTTVSTLCRNVASLKAKRVNKGLSYINAIFSAVWSDLFLSSRNLIDTSIGFISVLTQI